MVMDKEKKRFFVSIKFSLADHIHKNVKNFTVLWPQIPLLISLPVRKCYLNQYQE